MPNKPGGVFAGSDTTVRSMLPLSVWNEGGAAEEEDDEVASQETAPSAATDTRSSTTDRGPDSVD